MNLRNQKKANMDEEGKKEAQNKKSDKHIDSTSHSLHTLIILSFFLLLTWTIRKQLLQVLTRSHKKSVYKKT